MQKALETLGIRPSMELGIDILLGEHFNGSLYGMDPGQMERVRALREIVATYGQSRTQDVARVACVQDALKILYPSMGSLSREEVTVIFLNNMNRVLHVETLYKGSTGEVAFGARDVISRALGVGATALIVAHNHPSGDPHPSRSDIRQTETLKKACDVFDMALLDHIIISRGSCYSFAEERTSTVNL